MAKSNLMNSLNIFMRYIYDKEPLKVCNIFKYWAHKRSLKKFKKNIYESSPSFNILWQMADFIKLAESVFFYKNTQKESSFGLYSSRNYAVGTNGFRVSDFNKGLRVTIKLYNESRKVLLEIEYLNSDNAKQIMSFTNNEWDTMPTAYDEMLLDQIIRSINFSIMNLFDHCYDQR